MHLTMRGMLLLFLLVLFTQNYFSHGDLIADTCKKTEYPRICVSTLRSNPDSKTADVKGLVRIILKAALVYEEALDEIPEAIVNVGTNNFEANIEASATIDIADDCEESFSNSPFTADNNAVKQLAVVAVDIIASLG